MGRESQGKPQLGNVPVQEVDGVVEVELLLASCEEWETGKNRVVETISDTINSVCPFI